MLIDIKFLNRRTYLAFQEEFIALVKNYYKDKLDDMDLHDDMPNNRIRVSEKLVKKSDAFLVDKTPNFKLANDQSTPTYRNSFGKIVLTDDKDSIDSKKPIMSSGRFVCFNCDKDSHSLRDCPEPRNMKKVNKARNEFNRKDLRYHDDNENEYGNMVPGTISDELRSALGLSPTQIPLHVYRMRLFGYPPAWVEEAKVHHSGLSLFVEKDKRQLQPGEDDREVDNSFKYDVQKIFDFPGFNVAPEHPYMDQHRMFSTPLMNPQHSKEEMIRSLGDDIVNGYKKTKLRDSGAIVDISGGERTILTVADMEMDSGDETTIPLGVTVQLPSEPMEDGELSCDSTRSKSPNEEQLKEQRKALLAEIAESSVFLDTSTIQSDISASVTAESFNCSQLESTIIENSVNENRDNCAKDSGSDRAGFVDTTVVGCPILPSFSGHSVLPAGEKFQEGVSDVINFENLAESTGKYEKMKLLIKKVRTFQQEHQKE